MEIFKHFNILLLIISVISQCGKSQRITNQTSDPTLNLNQFSDQQINLFPWLPLERWLAKQKVIYILSCISWQPRFNAFHPTIFDIVDLYEKSLTHFCYDRNIAAIGRSSSLHLWCHTKVKPGKSIPCTFTQHSNCIIK